MSQSLPLVQDFRDGSAASMGTLGSEWGEWAALQAVSGIRPGRIAALEIGGSPKTNSQPFFYANDDLGVNISPAIGAIHNYPVSADVTTSATFQMVTLGGPHEPQFFRKAGVVARVQGGTYANGGTEDAALTLFNGYGARLNEASGYPTFQYRFQLLKITAGLISVMAETSPLDPAILGDAFATPFSISLKTTTVGSTVELEASLTGIVFLGLSSGADVTVTTGPLLPSGPLLPQASGAPTTQNPATGGPFTGPTATDGRLIKAGQSGNGSVITLTKTDSSSAFTTAGRSGLLGQRDNNFAPTKAGLLSPISFQVETASTTELRDEFSRLDPLKTASDPMRHSLASRVYGGVTFGVDPFDLRFSGEERADPFLTNLQGGRLVKSGSGTGVDLDYPGPDGTGSPTQQRVRHLIPSLRNYGCDYEVSFEYTTGTSTDAEMWIDTTLGYVKFDFSTATDNVYLFFNGGLFGAFGTATGSATLTIGSTFQLRAQFLIKPDEEQGFRTEGRAWINGLPLTLVAGVGANDLSDGGVVFPNYGQGEQFSDATFVFRAGAAGAPTTELYSITERDVASEDDVPTQVDPDNLAVYELAKESDGATGTLSLDYEFAVNRTLAARRGTATFDNQQQSRLLEHVFPRRVFELNHGSMDQTLADQWLAFWEAHRNEIPFTWAPIEDDQFGNSGTFRFVRGTWSLERVGPVYSMTVTVEELLS